VRSITTGMINELMKASTLGNVAPIKSLVAGGVDVETQDELGWRPTHMAAEREQLKSVRALARLGASARRWSGQAGRDMLATQCGANVDTSTDDDAGNKAALNAQADVDGNWPASSKCAARERD
jgi:ankyrin repeat protein